MHIRMTHLLFCAGAGAAVFTVLLERFTLWGTILGAAIAVYAANAVCAAAAAGTKPADTFASRPRLNGRSADASDTAGKMHVKQYAGLRLLRYGILLLFDMAVSTVRQIKTVLRPNPPVPAILHSKPQTDGRGRVLVANSVTLTPGTVTLEETEEDYAILCADPPESPEKRSAITSAFEQRLSRKEGTS